MRTLWLDNAQSWNIHNNTMKLLTLSIVLSSAHGFGIPVLPGDVYPVIDKLATFVPLTTNDSMELAGKTALIPLIIYAPFSQKHMKNEVLLTPPPPTSIEEIDFDAPLDRQLKVGHIVHRQPWTLGLGTLGTLTLPTPLQNTFHLYEPEHKFELPEDIDEQWIGITRNECYLGKDLTAKECVDFDPIA